MRGAGRRHHRPAQRGPEGFPLVNATDAATYLRRDHGIRVAPATIRDWARRKQITTHALGRDRYDLREVFAHAQRRARLDSNSLSCHT